MRQFFANKRFKKYLLTIVIIILITAILWFIGEHLGYIQVHQNPEIDYNNIFIKDEDEERRRAELEEQEIKRYRAIFLLSFMAFTAISFGYALYKQWTL